MRDRTPSDETLNAFAEDIRRGGEGMVVPPRRQGVWRRVAALPFSWLAFPLAWWLFRLGLLRLALALGFAAAPVLAVVFILWDAWSRWRAGRASA